MFKDWKLETRDMAQTGPRISKNFQIYRRFLIACSQRQEQIKIR